MRNGIFGGGLATDLLILDDIAQQEKKRKQNGQSNAYNSVSAFDFGFSFNKKSVGIDDEDEDDDD